MDRSERSPFRGHDRRHGHGGERGSRGRDFSGHGKYGGRGGEGRRGGRGGRGGRGAGYSVLCAEEGTHLLMVGSYSCTRHKGVERLELQREGKLSFLCLQEIDWITGTYLVQIEEAAVEVVRTYSVKKLILFGGCQVELQSLDTQMLTESLTARLGIPVEFHRGCHLIGYGDELAGKGERT